MALVGAMDYEWAVVYLTLLYTGSVIMTMNYTQDVSDLETEFQLLKPDVLLYGKIDDNQKLWAEQMTEAETASMYEIRQAALPEVTQKYELDPDFPACVLFYNRVNRKEKRGHAGPEEYGRPLCQRRICL